MLQQTRKGSLKMLDYLNTINSFADNLTLAGSPVPIRQLVSQITAGLDEEYTPIVVMIQSKSEITWVELQAELHTYEKRMEQLLAIKGGVTVNQAKTNLVSSRTGNFNSRAHGHSSSISQGREQNQNNFRGGRGRSRGRGGRGNNSKPTCQVCGRFGHTAAVCYYRYDNQYMGNPPEQNKNNNPTAFIAAPDVVNDPAWYADSGASNHVIGDLSNLNPRAEYTGSSMSNIPDQHSNRVSHDQLEGNYFSPSRDTENSLVQLTSAQEGTPNTGIFDDSQETSIAPQPVYAPLGNKHHMITRGKAGIFKPTVYIGASKAHHLCEKSNTTEPTSVTEALQIVEWKNAMDEEYRALMTNKTWQLVPYSPNMNLVGNKWVYKLKHNSAGSIKSWSCTWQAAYLFEIRVLYSVVPDQLKRRFTEVINAIESLREEVYKNDLERKESDKVKEEQHKELVHMI
ncbi:hypothetical protein LWI29_015218 [Acer saccharum]|uniref:Uncharacterized protein n=1 Tax=Acer saccharum TaxID=4024 RepID=A0AA39SVA8_ACESA|nr:hypothetical protein LWI29_015218 [Acer saccharum]